MFITSRTSKFNEATFRKMLLPSLGRARKHPWNVASLKLLVHQDIGLWQKQAKYYDQYSEPLNNLHFGEKVSMLGSKTWKPAVAMKRCEEPRKFIAKTENGKTFWRNRQHLHQIADSNGSDDTILKSMVKKKFNRTRSYCQTWRSSRDVSEMYKWQHDLGELAEDRSGTMIMYTKTNTNIEH